MSTTNINPYSNQSSNTSDNAKKVGVAAAAVGVAGAGTAAAMAAKRHFDSKAEDVVKAEEEIVPDAETPISEPKLPEEHAHHQPKSTPRPEQGTEHPQETPEYPETPESPKTPETPERPGTPETPERPETPRTPDRELSDEEIKALDEQNLDPDAVVDEVLAEEHVDFEGDDEAAGIMYADNYQEVQMIHGDDGEVVAAAVAYDQSGEPILLVDVDGDQIFDISQTQDGTMTDVSDLAINVGDAEVGIVGGDDYLANNGENTENFAGENFEDDIIS